MTNSSGHRIRVFEETMAFMPHTAAAHVCLAPQRFQMSTTIFPCSCSSRYGACGAHKIRMSLRDVTSSNGRSVGSVVTYGSVVSTIFARNESNFFKLYLSE